jgi:hypothetical protein
LSGRVFKGAYQSLKNSVKFQRNLMESLLRRLQASNDGLGKHAKYQPEGCKHNGPISGPTFI